MSAAFSGELLQAFRRAVRTRIAKELAEDSARSESRRAAVHGALPSALEAARAAGLLAGRAWLFGSYAWGSPGERSDVDLLVEGCPDVLELAVKIGQVLACEIHVVALEQAPQSLRELVLAQGRPL